MPFRIRKCPDVLSWPAQQWYWMREIPYAPADRLYEQSGRIWGKRQLDMATPIARVYVYYLIFKKRRIYLLGYFQLITFQHFLWSVVSERSCQRFKIVSPRNTSVYRICEFLVLIHCKNAGKPGILRRHELTRLWSLRGPSVWKREQHIVEELSVQLA